jgi:hypothetical protein
LDPTIAAFDCTKGIPEVSEGATILEISKFHGSSKDPEFGLALQYKHGTQIYPAQKKIVV